MDNGTLSGEVIACVKDLQEGHRVWKQAMLRLSDLIRRIAEGEGNEKVAKAELREAED